MLLLLLNTVSNNRQIINCKQKPFKYIQISFETQRKIQEIFIYWEYLHVTRLEWPRSAGSCLNVGLQIFQVMLYSICQLKIILSNNSDTNVIKIYIRHFHIFCMQALLTWTLPKDAEQPTAVDVAIL